MNCEKILHLSNCQTTINKPNMKKISLIALLALAACQSNKTETTDSTTVVADTVAAATAQPASEALCFELKDGQDVTAVKLVINGDEVSGEMQWLPWEKDGAIGARGGTARPARLTRLHHASVSLHRSAWRQQRRLSGRGRTTVTLPRP